MPYQRLAIALTLLCAPFTAMASAATATPDLTGHWVGYTGIVVFAVAYIMVMAEEYTHLRKSKPMILAAGIIWALIALWASEHGMGEQVHAAVLHNLTEYAELMLFLLVAMTYINALDERGLFDALRVWLIRRGFSFGALFWLTGILSFCISPVADNLTTALLMCAVVMAVGGTNTRFVGLSCINIVVAANAGGAFSPFGDITTLMVWQKGMVDFTTFFKLFVPSVVNFVVPAAIMYIAIPKEKPAATDEPLELKRGARRILVLFLATIATAVSFHQFLHLPPVVGMLTGLAYLQFFGFYLKCSAHRERGDTDGPMLQCQHSADTNAQNMGDVVPFDVFNKVARAEWDTLLFFYGVVLCVGGLGFMGYLSLMSEGMYTQWGPTAANIAVGVISAIVDNIPVMFAVLTMQPDMSTGQWLLVTMTAGVGGSLLSIGSAAGVALMGQARGHYTFVTHLKWAPVIALGYAASILVHFWWNANTF